MRLGRAWDHRWRRLVLRVDAVRTADPASPHAVPDAAAGALDALYDLWELWTVQHSLASWTKQHAAVADDSDGETVVAPVFARGGKTHSLVEFGVLGGFGNLPFGHGPFGHQGWLWQPYEDPNRGQRSGWYRSHVCYRPVIEPLDAAIRWFSSKREGGAAET